MKIKLMFLLVFLLFSSGCSKSPDESLRNDIENLSNKEEVLRQDIDTLQSQVNDMQMQLQIINDHISNENNTETNQMKQDLVLCTEEALLLFSEVGPFSISELGCAISTYKEGFLEISWTNPGGGTGGVWYVDPYSGDLYDWNDSFLYNLIDKMKDK